MSYDAADIQALDVRRYDLMSNEPYAGDLSPKEAWEILAKEPDAVLVDCRTDAEWNFVGVPDLEGIGKQVSLIPWQVFPSMEQNGQFVDQVAAQGGQTNAPVLLLCRSGVRSRNAAVALTASGFQRAYNISGGFEGPHDHDGHRGKTAGWKADDLPWKQG